MNYKRKNIKISNQLHGKRITKLVIIPALLLLLWLLLSFAFFTYRSFTVLQYPHYADKNNIFFNKQLLKGQKLVGVFRAAENNLGIIAIRFGNVLKPDYESEDTLIFRIKEKGKNVWIYENTFRSGLAYAFNYLPLGFETIPNSKGKIYEFELVSLNGNIANALKTDDINPVYLSKYKFSRHELLSNYLTLTAFIFKKIYTLTLHVDLLLSSLVFLLPFVIYMTWILIENNGYLNNILSLNKSKKYLQISEFIVKNYRHVIYRFDAEEGHYTSIRLLYMFLITLIIFTYIFYSKTYLPGLSLGLIGLWIIALYINRLNSFLSYLLAVIILFLLTLFTFFNGKMNINNSSSFAYFLFVIGVIQDIIEYKIRCKKN